MYSASTGIATNSEYEKSQEKTRAEQSIQQLGPVSTVVIFTCVGVPNFVLLS